MLPASSPAPSALSAAMAPATPGRRVSHVLGREEDPDVGVRVMAAQRAPASGLLLVGRGRRLPRRPDHRQQEQAAYDEGDGRTGEASVQGAAAATPAELGR